MKLATRTAIFTAAGLLSVTLLVSCDGDAVSGPGFICDVSNPVSEVVIKSESQVVLVHSPARGSDVGRVTAVANNRNGDARSDVPIKFASSDTTVATVDSLGIVHAVKPGSVKITASTCGKAASANLTVSLFTVSVKVKLDTSVVAAGDSVVVRAQAVGPDGANVPGAKFTFAAVPSTGISFAQRSDSTAIVKTSASGTFTITATGEGTTGSTQLRVLAVSVKVKLDTAAVVAGDSVVARAQAFTEDGVLIPGVTFVFSGTPPGLIIVQRPDSTAIVRTSTPGTFTVTATGRGVTGSAQLVVSPRIFVGSLAGALDGALDVGKDFGCGLIPLGRLYCWGANGFSQLAAATDSVCFDDQDRGGLSAACTLVPLRAKPSGVVFSSVSAGENFACGVAAAGAAYCWGQGTYGKIGNGHIGGVSVASLVTSALSFKSVTAGGEHACGLTVAGDAYCWGQDSLGELGDARRVNSTTPIPVYRDGLTAARFASISAGFRHTCAVQLDGVAACWGRDSTGELGTGGFISTDIPTDVVGGLRFIAISAGGDSIGVPLAPTRVEAHTCGIAVGGAAYCWGSNRSGQLGNGSYGDSSAVPVAVAGGQLFSKISAGGRHTCGLTTSGNIYCWGRNTDLQLGRGPQTGTGPDGSIPQMVNGGDLPGGVMFTTISAGRRHSCAVGTDGAAYCWGSNVYGALGNTLQAAFRGYPQKVATPK